ncbi:MAG: HAD-IA family hydrolase [Candidatus Roizmanbacteria bacterium]|nr:HAD-IA family hydrolase [Candidatus Roizmanbacteria bacterium]
MKVTYDGLIFDMDGVLVDVSKSYREAIRQTTSYFLERSVLMSEVDEIKNKVGMNNDWDATYALINNPNISYEGVKSYFQSIYVGNDQKSGLINNEKLLISKQKLQSLKNKYKKMGIATGRPKIEAEYVINKNQLNEIFDCVIALEDVVNSKPSPDSILMVIEKLNLKKTVYIGDSPSDVVAAERAKIPSIFVGKQNIGTIRFQTMLKVLQYLL